MPGDPNDVDEERVRALNDGTFEVFHFTITDGACAESNVSNHPDLDDALEIARDEE